MMVLKATGYCVSGLVASKDIEGLGGARAPLVAPVEPVEPQCVEPVCGATVTTRRINL